MSTDDLEFITHRAEIEQERGLIHAMTTVKLPNLSIDGNLFVRAVETPFRRIAPPEIRETLAVKFGKSFTHDYLVEEMGYSPEMADSLMETAIVTVRWIDYTALKERLYE